MTPESRMTRPSGVTVPPFFQVGMEGRVSDPVLGIGSSDLLGRDVQIKHHLRGMVVQILGVAFGEIDGMQSGVPWNLPQ